MHKIVNGHRYFSEDYQRVIVVKAHGKFENSDNHWVEDTSGIIYKAASWVPFD